ncbi:MAG: glycosyltransferase family 4 protein [Deltaproteobacteria bacterium]|nr:glycosyltransferase family 4 protein [Deltaproteobacteria bacterium]
MKIIQITPGSGDNFYCENCLRDQTLVKTLFAQGHEIMMVPLYLPIRLDSPKMTINAPIFYGGINVYLQQKLGLFRKTPRWLDSLFDNRSLLSKISKKAGMTSSKDLGETTISMLKGEHGHQVKELDRLIEWISSDMEIPDVVILSNVLLGGLAPALRERLKVPVVCLLQDEEAFVDGLGEPYSSEAWALIQKCSKEIDAFISVSKAYADRIAPRLNLHEARLHTVYMGIDIKDYQPAETMPAIPAIGFLSRMCPQRGLDTLIDAFILLKQRPELKSCCLQISGGMSQADEPFIRDLQRKLKRAGLTGDVVFIPEFLGEGRRQWLTGLSVMCVPEREEAAYGLFALEAQASGVPVIVPKIGIFPEMLQLTGGGLLVDSNAPEKFAAALAPLLINPDNAFSLGQKGRKGIEAHFDIQKTSRDYVGVLEKVIHRSA